IQHSILMRKAAVPGIGHRLAIRHEGIAPAVFGAVPTAACAELPFGFRGQILSDPLRIRERVLITNVDDRMITAMATRGAAGVGVPPARPEIECPPLAPIATSDRMVWCRKDQ